MDVGVPIRSVIPTLHGPVLAVLAGTTQALSGRHVARMLEGQASQRGVANALNDLVASGIVLREDHPPVALYTLNRDHLAAHAIEELSDMRGELLRRLRTEVESWAIPAETVVFFGSAARQTGDLSSDLDLLVVRPHGVEADDETWELQHLQLSTRARAWTGNVANIVEFGADEIDEIDPATEPLLIDVNRDGVLLAGEPLQRRPRPGRRQRSAK